MNRFQIVLSALLVFASVSCSHKHRMAERLQPVEVSVNSRGGQLPVAVSSRAPEVSSTPISNPKKVSSLHRERPVTHHRLVHRSRRATGNVTLVDPSREEHVVLKANDGQGRAVVHDGQKVKISPAMKRAE